VPVIARRRICVRHCEARLLRHCEAAQPPKQSSRATPRILGGRPKVLPCPSLDCFARASRGLAMTGTMVARARNDGGAAAARVMDGRRGHRPVHRHCEAAKPPKQSRRATPRILVGRPKVSPCPILDCFARASRGLAMTAERAAPRVMGGRPKVLPRPILDCFALASLALAMTEERTAPLPRPPAPVAIDEARSSRRNSPRADCWR